MKMILKTLVATALLLGSFAVQAGHYTYDGGVREIRFNADKTLYVFLNETISETACANKDFYVLKANNGAYEQIKEAINIAYLQKKTVSFKNSGGCFNDQPVIKFMRLR